jgi:hypothetical protein
MYTDRARAAFGGWLSRSEQLEPSVELHDA